MQKHTPANAPLTDLLGRTHTSLRISVTDRCNIRCFYCMPEQDVDFCPRDEILTFEEICRFVRAVLQIGVNKFRITGGEPLVRADLPDLVKQLNQMPGVVDLAVTTNGTLLRDQAAALRAAGLRRLNISLDTLQEETFLKITRREGLDRVLDGIAVAQTCGFEKIRLNAIAIRGFTEHDIVPLGRFAREQNLELRFIEFMPLDADAAWQSENVLTGAMLRQMLEAEFGPLEPVPRTDPAQPAVDYQFADGGGRIGFINPVSSPFCSTCNRLRITAEGQVRNCLFSTTEWDARAKLRQGASDTELIQLVRECVSAKAPAHGIGTDDFVRPQRAMYQIGG
jgi:cyclic pyranopterin phosphate synthase